MKFLELSNTLNITERKINSISIIKSKIESHLHAWLARTNLTDTVITFKNTIFNSGTSVYIPRYKLLEIIREGKIVLEKQRSSLRISWVVKLDTLYFMALCFSAILFIITHSYCNIELIYAFSISLAFFLLMVFLGIQLIKYRLTDMIYSCVYPKT